MEEQARTELLKPAEVAMEGLSLSPQEKEELKGKGMELTATNLVQGQG